MIAYAWIPVLGVVFMTVATIGLGLWATQRSKTASDFFVAGRSVSVFWNASAISGEYLSAASFMGIAGLLMKNGYDALWYPACYAAGYLFLLLFIAGPLRRFGAYTIPDFAEGRFDSPAFRKVAVSFVLFIGFFYTMPQMKGAGVVMGAILDLPYWAGIVVVGVVITFNVAFGGMKGITFVQAFQYWAKLFAISAPVFILASVFGHYAGNLESMRYSPEAIPPLSGRVESEMSAWTTIKVKGAKDAPANALVFPGDHSVQIQVPKGAVISKLSATHPETPGAEPMGELMETDEPSSLGTPPSRTKRRFRSGAGPITIPAESELRLIGHRVTRAGRYVMRDGVPLPTTTKIEFAKPTEIRLPSFEVTPNAPPDGRWIAPFGPLTSKHGYPLLYTYSLIIALICGTAGLPHILVRFYTNPDGRAAKRTTLWVMVMLGSFYIFPPIWGTMGRLMDPVLYATGLTDRVVITLPRKLASPLLGQILSAITSAGAFAAFMSTFSGLLVSMSGALAHDIYGKILCPGASPNSRMRMFKFAAVAIGAASMALGFLVESFDIAMMVGWAFAIAACSYFPLLLLGSWWRGLTKYGAGCGMLGGGVLSLCAIVTSMLLDKKVLTFSVSPLMRSLMEQPAIWGVPLALGLMVIVSLATAKAVPSDVDLKMLRLHAPEEMGLSKNYIEH
ncbi:MAG: Na+/solute symporter [Planctomycetota bacterium]|nr:Na+/solute symporter [Planctomycetota bacterium]